ncbi:DUF6879 family protein [Phytohabitans maris]|uniref:DUF6879 family protein n=1 Tax=Phytohabitans maris TaxID=3071409 RepID=UPI00280A6760|nr:DUF6879 family protein [Phytohabitans sp. ZYX-F-186]
MQDKSDWRVTRKILITTTTGAVAYLLTNLTTQPRIWGITMSVFVAGAILVVQFLIDFARWNIAQTADLIRDLNDGLATYAGEDWTWLFGLTETAQRTIDATSLVSRIGTGRGVDEGVWTSDQGRRYLQMQRRAIDRGVRIRRIFILDPPADVTDEVVASCEQHRQSGVDVRLLDPSNLDWPDRSAHSDFVLFDGVMSYEIFSSVSFEEMTKPLIFATHLERRPNRVDGRKQWFEALWSRAVEFEQHESGPRVLEAVADPSPTDAEGAA